ncbi:MAG TPA: hypothetical protein VMH22_00695 [bacterium]|nr:hypothetical protein [bacterium]
MFAVLALTCSVTAGETPSAGTGQTPDGTRQESCWPVVGEAAGAVAGEFIADYTVGTVLFFVMWCNANDHPAVAVAGEAAVAATLALGSAGGASLVGLWTRQHGTFLGSLAGAGVGVVAFGACVFASDRFRGNHVANTAFAMAAPFCPPAGAVIGYNMSRRSLAQTGLESRLLSPELSISPVRTARQSRIEVQANVRLLSFRF